ncbi:MAG: HIT family protein [Lachnospiraceae bacterium]|nr:HIT family protein [Lachnospiraceae bacterium]
MKESTCIFCKIAAGEIPSKTIYEDEDFRVILDISPATKGHALILPKEHYANLYELPDEMAGKVMLLAKRLAAQMTEALGCDGFNLVQNNGEVAGQTVFHFHLHLIPRYQGDGNEDKICWNHLELSQEELDKIHQLLILTKLP